MLLLLLLLLLPTKFEQHTVGMSGFAAAFELAAMARSLLHISTFMCFHVLHLVSL